VTSAPSLWLSEPAPPLLSGAIDGRPDVIVVGAGVTGCSCALALARAGLRVRVHDSRQVAGGASGRNGGFALRGGAMPYDLAREWLGPEQARAYWRLTEQALDRLEELAGDSFRRVGSLRLAVDEEEREELLAEFQALHEDGFAAEWRFDFEAPLAGRFCGAIFHAPDGVLQPARLVRRLAAKAAQAGAEIREWSRVASLDELDAERVVVATDGYPSGLLGELEGLIIPTRGQVIATEPLEERLFEIPHYGRHGFDYWHQTPDGRLVAGGFRDYSLQSEFTADEVTTEAIQEAIESFVEGLLGRRPAIEHRWAGIFGMVPDLMPVVGPVPGKDRLWVAGGYSGHGNVLGFLCGELVARAILGDVPDELALFDPARLLA
jgi:glycine/D-amino acid oxidase-like deaminating enzyme